MLNYGYQAINKRWENQKSNQSDTNEYICIQENTNGYINDNDNVNVNVNDNDNVNDNEHGALGEKREKKRKNYSEKKSKPYSEGEPTYDIEAFTKKAIGIKYEKKERMNN